ncbi:MAG: GNAT family N-acetyltransferase [Treponema sp.]|jgi:Leu/Phe-tRNA-protein transferase|nr:GNAT family N-acetyltransferase [Treponema sp.]
MRHPSLRYTYSGHIFIDSEDDIDAVVDAMLESGYNEEFCIAQDFNPSFIARLMAAGFLVMSAVIEDNETSDDAEQTDEDARYMAEDGAGLQREAPPQKLYFLLPKLHLVRNVLFFENLHIKKSIKHLLNRYELRVDTDFDLILNHCVWTHGSDWLTSPLVETIRKIRKAAPPLEKFIPAIRSERRNTAGFSHYTSSLMEVHHRIFGRCSSVLGIPSVRPVSFGVYRNGELKAGEFGIIEGRVYTSYSGYYDEDNAGTVQIILTAQYLQSAGFDFFDMGMPLAYKYALGSQDIDPFSFVKLFRRAQMC